MHVHICVEPVFETRAIMKLALIKFISIIICCNGKLFGPKSTLNNTNIQMAQDISSLPIEVKTLFAPSYDDIKNVLTAGLKSNYENVNVEIVDCPDLTKAPFSLASPGLGGNGTIVDLGGPPYLLPLVHREKLYDLKELPKVLNIEPILIIGAGAGPFPFAETNCEGVFNFNITNGTINQKSVIGVVDKVNNTHTQISLPSTETRCALLGNFYACNGAPGTVLKINVKQRKGEIDFAANIRTILHNHYKGKIVGLGGTFLINNGKVKQHVMPDFSDDPLNTEEDLNNWLHFYEMSTPLVAVGTLVSDDPGLDLRVQHFHSFSDHNEAGHYHIDVTPKDIEYLGYFSIANRIVRIDRPENTHNIGRD